MAIKSGFSTISFTNSSNPTVSGSLVISEERGKDEFVSFKRTEWTGDRMRSAKNEDGSLPVFGLGTGGTPLQYFSNCNPNETARPTDPDDDRIDSIFKRFDTVQWRIIGDVSEAADVAKLRSVCQEHKTRLARFEAHQEIAQSGDVSYTFLTEQLQPETFSYLTTTNLSMTGRVFGDAVTEVNLLLISFEPITEYLIPLFGEPSNTDVLKGWEMILERRVIRAARSTSW